MIARSCGASVFKAPQKEVGWSEVSISDTGKEDMLFRGFSKTLPVFQWHEDTFDLPVGGHLLATSAACHNQAFRYSNAYGLQFHVEVTPQILSEWFGLSPEGEKMIRHMEKLEVDFMRQALKLYSNFVDWVKGTRRFNYVL
jgi:GMP synthase-like glutamine amidotransferase